MAANSIVWQLIGILSFCENFVERSEIGRAKLLLSRNKAIHSPFTPERASLTLPADFGRWTERPVCCYGGGVWTSTGEIRYVRKTTSKGDEQRRE
jgi:hypothetical protein